MTIFLILIPLLVVISGLFMYQFNGRKQLLKLDLVQFIYAFIISPVLFIWLKTFLFYLIRRELELGLNVTQLFILDTSFTILFLYIYAFVVIHSLTKTFNLKREDDPLYDIFEHSEYFHMWLSHFAIYMGGMVILTFLSITNLFLPLQLEASKATFYVTLILAYISGISVFTAVWNYESPEPNFMRLMKLGFGLSFLIQAIAYFVFDPVFNVSLGAYWFIFMIFFATVAMSLFAERAETQTGLFKHLPYRLNWRKPNYYVRHINKVAREWFGR